MHIYNLILAWISNDMSTNVWDEDHFPSLSLNSCTSLRASRYGPRCWRNFQQVDTCRRSLFPIFDQVYHLFRYYWVPFPVSSGTPLLIFTQSSPHPRATLPLININHVPLRWRSNLGTDYRFKLLSNSSTTYQTPCERALCLLASVCLRHRPGSNPALIRWKELVVVDITSRS